MRHVIGALLLTTASPIAVGAQTIDADTRAAATLAQMTQEEKLSVLQGYLTARMPEGEKPKGIPSSAGHVPGVPRLKVPVLVESDASLGVANMGGFMRPNDGATALPSGMSLGSTWNPDIAEEAGRMIGAEARAKGFNVLLAGGVNLVREPRNGRNFEYLGEDPLHSGILVGHSIRGVQSNHIVSTIKHYALNAQETGRTFLDARMSDSALHESDLLAFRIGMEIGRPGSVMCGYNKINGVWACENPALLNDVLRRQWGFKGWVMSDWGAVHSVSIREGLDQESGTHPKVASYFGRPLQQALAAGTVAQDDVDRSVRRILRTLYATGVADHPVGPATAIDAAANAAVAQRVAEQGIVLLKNAGGLLPIASHARRILVVGGHADVGVPQGGGSSQVWPVGGAALSLAIPGDAIYHRRLYMPSSPLKALQERFPQAEVGFDDGSDHSRAASAARDADIVIVFAEQFTAEGHDVLDLALPESQDALIEAVAAANPRTVVVLETGGPVVMPWLDRVPAVLEAWYGGQRGGQAIARVLSGDVNPSGRLPVTFPASTKQLPNPSLPGIALITPRPGSDLYDLPKDEPPLTVEYPEGADVGYRWYARTKATPLFAFGHGLSYTSFSTDALKVAGTSATFTVRNTGARAGGVVTQLYLVGQGERPVRRLVGFQRVDLVPGASAKLRIAIDPRLLAQWRNGAWTMASGSYRFALGDSAEQLGPAIRVTLPAKKWMEAALPD